jgi:hypothetical protein
MFGRTATCGRHDGRVDLGHYACMATHASYWIPVVELSENKRSDLELVQLLEPVLEVLGFPDICC